MENIRKMAQGCNRNKVPIKNNYFIVNYFNLLYKLLKIRRPNNIYSQFHMIIMCHIFYIYFKSKL